MSPESGVLSFAERATWRSPEVGKSGFEEPPMGPAQAIEHIRVWARTGGHYGSDQPEIVDPGATCEAYFLGSGAETRGGSISRESAPKRSSPAPGRERGPRPRVRAGRGESPLGGRGPCYLAALQLQESRYWLREAIR